MSSMPAPTSTSAPTGEPFPRLNSPLQVQSLRLSNRIVMPAMHLNMTPAGQVTDQLVNFYAARAKGGAGIVIIGGCPINATAGPPFMLSLRSDDDLPGLGRLADALHEAGGYCALQLYHAGSYAHAMLLGGEQPVSASAVTSGFTGETPKELSVPEIKALVADFAAAAARTKRAGFDAVEVCGSAGYTVCQFLSPKTNLRTDEYGGDEAGRMRFGVEVARAIREAVGPDFAFFFRVAGNPYVPGAGGSGLTARFAAALEKAGVDVINVTGGWHETRVPQLTGAVPSRGLTYLARVVREQVSVPVVACNRITTPEVAEAVLRDGHGDLISLGRALIADPEFPLKVREGRSSEVVHCVACNQGCFDAVFNLVPCRCMANPVASIEGEVAAAKAVLQVRRVVVVGAGPAGLAAAWAAAGRGHRVIVLERGTAPGGQLRLASRYREKREFKALYTDLLQRAILAGVEIRYETEGTPESVKKRRPDVVLVATGARPVRPDLPGADLPHVVQAWDVFNGQVEVGDRVVVVGGGATGCEVALHLSKRGTIDPETVAFLLVNEAEPPEEIRRLATRGTREVTVVEMTRKLGSDIGKSTRWGVIQDLGRYGVVQRKNTRVVRIEPDAVVVDRDGATERLACDHVVLATGVQAISELAEALKGEAFEVRLIGDAREPRKALTAVHEGFDVGIAL